MSEINFLDNRPDKGENKPDKRAAGRPEIAWSEPDKSEPPRSAGAGRSFWPFNKKPAGAAAQASPAKADLKQSRREILKQIRQAPALQSAPDAAKEKNIFSGWGGMLKKSKDHKQILIDYQRIFNDEKSRRVQPAVTPAPAPAARAGGGQPRSAAPKKIGGPSWFSRLSTELKKNFKRFLAAAVPAKPVDRPVFKAPQPPVMNQPKPEAVKPVPAPAPPITPPPAPAAAVEETKQEDFPEVPETNLITGEIITFIDWRKKIMGLSAAVLIPLIFLALIYAGLGVYQRVNSAGNQELIKKNQELALSISREQAGLKEIIDYGEKLKTASQVFSNHVYWSNFFRFLEDNTIKDVYFTGFSGDTGGSYELSAVANTYGDIADQVALMKKSPYATEVEATAGELVKSTETKNEIKVKFNLKFKLSKNIFTD